MFKNTILSEPLTEPRLEERLAAIGGAATAATLTMNALPLLPSRQLHGRRRPLPATGLCV